MFACLYACLILHSSATHPLSIPPALYHWSKLACLCVCVSLGQTVLEHQQSLSWHELVCSQQLSIPKLSWIFPIFLSCCLLSTTKIQKIFHSTVVEFFSTRAHSRVVLLGKRLTDCLLLICTGYLVEIIRLYKRKQAQITQFSLFFFWLSRLQLKSPSKLLSVAMSTMGLWVA